MGFISLIVLVITIYGLVKPDKLIKSESMSKGKKRLFIVIGWLVLTVILAQVPTGEDSNNSPSSKSENKTEASVNTDSINKAKAEAAKAAALKKQKNDSILAVVKKDFHNKKDEFSDKVWIEPNNEPKYTNQNAVYCYFEKDGGSVSNFRLRLQYTSDDWLFIENVIFNCDGNNYTYTPEKVDRDNDTRIWEWFDEQVSAEDEPLIKAIANAKTVKMKLNGQQYYDVRTMTKAQIYFIKQAYTYYKLSGGQFY